MVNGNTDFHVLVDEEHPAGLRVEVGCISVLPFLRSAGVQGLVKAKRHLEKIVSLEGQKEGPSVETINKAKNALDIIERGISLHK